MQMRAGDLLESLDAQERWDRERERAELLIDAARIAAGHNMAEVLAPYLDDEEDQEMAQTTGEEVFDLTDSDWEAPDQDEMAMLDALLAQQRVTVPNGPAPAGPPMDDDGSDQQWL